MALRARVRATTAMAMKTAARAAMPGPLHAMASRSSRPGPCGDVGRAFGLLRSGLPWAWARSVRVTPTRGANPAAQQVGHGARRMDDDPCPSRDSSLLRRERK